jgi:hypothetical protein
MVTGKLEGAWRVVARSLPRRLRFHPDGFSRDRRNADCNLAPKTLHFKAGIAFDLQNSATKLIGVTRLVLEEHPLHYCAELILWTSRTGD